MHNDENLDHEKIDQNLWTKPSHNITEHEV